MGIDYIFIRTLERVL